LQTISTQVANITTSLDIDSNAENLIVEFPNLIWAANLTFRNISSISLQSLANVTGTLGFYSNFFETLSAPNLTSVGGVLTFVANSGLNNISMDALTSVGGLEIANNTDLIKIDDFSSLKTVDGLLDVTGNYSDAEFPALASVAGAFHMVSSSNFSCATFNANEAKGTFYKGTYTCTPTSTNVQSEGGGSSGSGTGTGSSPSSTSTKGAAGHLDVPTAFGLMGGFLAMLL